MYMAYVEGYAMAVGNESQVLFIPAYMYTEARTFAPKTIPALSR